MSEKKSFNWMDDFKSLREQRKKISGLQLRMCLFVTGEMLLCVVIGLGVDKLLNFLFDEQWNVPLGVDLIVACILVGMLLTRVILRTLIGPISKMTKAMDKVAEGDFNVKLETKSTAKEIKEVFSGFNFMTEQLKANEILQSDFISGVSHEFKTPLAAIEGYSTLLQDCDNLDDSQKENVEKIIFNTKRLSALTGNILLLSKIENDSIPAKKNTYRLDEQIRQSIFSLEPLWSKKEIEFDINMEEISFLGTENLLYHVWTNLISNAIKFSPDGGKISIYLTDYNGGVEFIIEDNGPGISKDAQKHIFDKFYQADTSHKSEGNGLGLALVKKIITAEGGTVDVENIKNGGCRFTIQINNLIQ